MKASIANGIVKRTVDKPGKLRDMSEIITILHDCGYDTLDLGFTEMAFPDFFLNADDWQSRVDAFGNTAAKLGVTFGQSHLPFVKFASTDMDPNWKKPGYPEFFAECMRRAYVACSMLGIRYATAHPHTYVDFVASPKLQMQKNHEFYDGFVEFGIKHNVCTAFENMRPEEPAWSIPSRFCQYYGELIDFVDSYNDPMVVICWDTGHANQAGNDQGRAIRAMGKRLKSLHINDNHYGGLDEHRLPFMGTIDWESAMSALADIGYEGTLNYEVGKICDNAPEVIQYAWVRTARANADLLLDIYRKYCGGNKLEEGRNI